jgi:hypothetical protein
MDRHELGDPCSYIPVSCKVDYFYGTAPKHRYCGAFTYMITRWFDIEDSKIQEVWPYRLADLYMGSASPALVYGRLV